MASVISIDLDKLNSAVSRYDAIIDEFEGAIRDTEKAINILKSTDWKSAASTAYFMHYEDTWKKNMKTRVKILKHLRTCLEKAQIEYQSVYDEMMLLDTTLN